MPTVIEELAKRYASVRAEVVEDLEAHLAATLATIEGAHPGLRFDRGRLVDHLGTLDKPIDALADESVEVAVVLAALDGDPSVLEAEYLAMIPANLGSMKLDEAMVEEVTQEVRRKLLVGDPPKILDYVGRGSLRGLLKVTATRTAISMLRKQRHEAPGDAAVLDRSGERDPELAFLKEHYRGAFRRAFEAAVAELEPRERNLLRLHFLRKVTLEQLATMYGVHRATIVRQLARVREKLDKATRRDLASALSLPKNELESVMDLVRSRFDVSVERLLRTMEE